MRKICITLSLFAMLVVSCDTARRVGGVLLPEVPVIGQFLGEWLNGEDLSLEVKLQEELALVKQYFDGKLQQVATNSYVEEEELIMEFTRKNNGKVTGKLTKNGEFSVDYGDTIVVMDLAKSEN